MVLKELYENLYKALPRVYTFNYWKSHVTFTAGYEVTVNLKYDYVIKYDETKENDHEPLKAYFVQTEAKELTFFDFLKKFSTLNSEKNTEDLVYISVPDVYLNQLMRYKGNFIIINGKDVRTFNFRQALYSIRVYSMGKGELSAPSIPFYIFSKDVPPPDLVYLLSAIHFYNALLLYGVTEKGIKEGKRRLFYPLVYWRLFESNKQSIVGRDTARRIINLILKENPVEADQIVKELCEPHNEYLEEMIKRRYDETTNEILTELQEQLAKENKRVCKT